MDNVRPPTTLRDYRVTPSMIPPWVSLGWPCSTSPTSTWLPIRADLRPDRPRLWFDGQWPTRGSCPWLAVCPGYPWDVRLALSSTRYVRPDDVPHREMTVNQVRKVVNPGSWRGGSLAGTSARHVARLVPCQREDEGVPRGCASAEAGLAVYSHMAPS